MEFTALSPWKLIRGPESPDAILNEIFPPGECQMNLFPLQQNTFATADKILLSLERKHPDRLHLTWRVGMDGFMHLTITARTMNYHF